MNKHNAKDYLPFVQALADGKTIQGLLIPSGEWCDLQHEMDFQWPAEQYRIKPEPVRGWYRVALMTSEKTNWTISVESEEEIAAAERFPHFIRWLTDRIEYEVEA
jgi:hypothetical protein